MERRLFIVVLAIVLAIPSWAQFNKNAHGSTSAVTFRSTSAMTGAGSAYSSNPILNDNGTAAYSEHYSPAQAPGKPYKAPPPLNSDDDFTEETGQGLNTPVGDAVIPLLLMVMVYAAYIFPRRKRA